MFEKLTTQQRIFCAEFLIDLKVGAAAERAGFSASRGTALMKRQDIREFIGNLMQRRAERLVVNQNNILEELSAIGFSDIRSVFDADGKLLNVADLGGPAAHALAAFKVREVETDDGRITRTTEIKFSDKLKALELAGRHLGLFIENRHMTVDFTDMDDEELLKQAVKILPSLLPQDEGFDFL